MAGSILFVLLLVLVLVLAIGIWRLGIGNFLAPLVATRRTGGMVRTAGRTGGAFKSDTPVIFLVKKNQTGLINKVRERAPVYQMRKIDLAKFPNKPVVIVAQEELAVPALSYQRDHLIEVRGMVLINPTGISAVMAGRRAPDNVIAHLGRDINPEEDQIFSHIEKTLDPDDIAENIYHLLSA